MNIKAQGIDLSIRCGPPATEGWRVASVEVAVPGFSGSYQCQLMTDDLKVFHAQLKEMHRSVGRECTAALTTTDTLVAAAAVSNEATLVTANVRDYPMEEVELLQQP